MKVYLAAPYPWRDQAIAQMVDLEAAGFEVTSTWLREGDTEDDVYARRDLADIDRADIVVINNPFGYENSGTGGRHVELGYAVGVGKRILLVGPRTNIFHHLSDVMVTSSTEIVSSLWAMRLEMLSDVNLIRSLAARDAVAAVVAEFKRASAAYAPFHSHHEGYAVIAEELDELWDDVKANRHPDALREAVQVGAMALRFLTDLREMP